VPSTCFEHHVFIIRKTISFHILDGYTTCTTVLPYDEHMMFEAVQGTNN